MPKPPRRPEVAFYIKELRAPEGIELHPSGREGSLIQNIDDA
jgi:hypothetical protein